MYLPEWLLVPIPHGLTLPEVVGAIGLMPREGVGAELEPPPLGSDPDVPLGQVQRHSTVAQRGHYWKTNTATYSG